MRHQIKTQLIGIVGGMGPLAGLNLSEKIINNTLANSDQEHLPQILYTDGSKIADRSEFILGKTKKNPANAIAEILMKLDNMGATVAAIPCNTAHASEIFNIIQKELDKRGSKIHLLDMINEVGIHIQKEYPGIKRVGILGTNGTFKAQQYNALKVYGIDVLYVTESEQKKVHEAIYDRDFGIKAKSNPISVEAIEIVYDSIQCLKAKGAEAIILACTELTLLKKEDLRLDTLIIDSSFVLARALVNYVAHKKLLPFIHNTSKAVFKQL